MPRRAPLAHRRVNILLLIQETALLNAVLAMTWVTLRFPGPGAPLRDWPGAPPTFPELAGLAALSALMPRRGGGGWSRAARAGALLVTGVLTWWPGHTPQPYLGVTLSLGALLLSLRVSRAPWWREAIRARGPLRALSAALPDWRLASGHHRPDSRVLLSPDGHAITLSVSTGQEYRQSGGHTVRWTGATEGNLRRTPWRGQLLLWIHLPRPQGDYHPEPWDDLPGTTLIGTTQQAAQWMSTQGGGAIWPGIEEQRRAERTRRDALNQLRDELPGTTLSGLLLQAPGGTALLWPHPTAHHPDAPHSRLIRALRQRYPEAPLWAPLMTAEHCPWPGAYTGHASGLVPLLQHAAQETPHNPGGRGHRADDHQRGPREQGNAGTGQRTGTGKTAGAAADTGAGAGPHSQPDRPRRPEEILELGDDHSPAAVRAAYARLAKRYHPDRLNALGEEFRVLAEIRMKEINAAYEAVKAASRDRTQ